MGTNHDPSTANSRYLEHVSRLSGSSHRDALFNISSTFGQRKAEVTQVSELYMCTVHGLAPDTTLADLCSPTLCPSGLLEGKISHPEGPNGPISATLLFSTQSEAAEAKEIMERMLRLFNKNSTVRIDLTQVAPTPSETTTADQSLTKRHKFSEEDKSFLEEQFCINSRPSAQQRRVIANELCVDEKRIQTWFNNQRQRQRAEGR